MLFLVEHFYSIQGEGKRVGTPSLFFRFGGCNLRCEGFGCSEVAQNGDTVFGCDTLYAVDREHFSKNWVVVESADELLSIVDSYDLPSGAEVVFTGGEPLIYANDEIFVAFLEALDELGRTISFETNGTVGVDFERFSVYKKASFALSVKLSNSNEPLSKRLKGEILHSIASSAKEAFFKFSIDTDSITLSLEDEIDEIIAFAPNLPVYCMPLGGSREEVETNTKPLIEFCKEKGYRFSDRLHIRIWDQNRGV